MTCDGWYELETGGMDGRQQARIVVCSDLIHFEKVVIFMSVNDRYSHINNLRLK